MRVLLVYPQYVHHNTFDSRSPSLSLLYLASRLESDGHEVRILDASGGPITKVKNGYLYGMQNDEVASMLSGQRYDLVGITCSFASRWPFVKALSALFKRMWNNVPVVIGGLFPTYDWEYCLSNSTNIDAVVLGEGEETLSKIVGHMEGGFTIQEACKELDGVAWRDGGELKKNDKKGYIDDLDRLPFPAWHLLDLNRMSHEQRNFYDLRPTFLTVLSSRSCPYACSFCNMYITHGHKWRPRSPENFVDELEFLMNRYNVKRFFIADDNFSFDIERAKSICREIIKRGLKIQYNTGNGLNIKKVDRELFELMKASGCGSIALAIESGSERIRNEVYKKRLHTERIYEAVKLCDDVGLPAIGFFMVGAPGENRQSVEETKKLIRELPLTLCTCSIYTPYPKTSLYDECVAKGYLRDLNPQSEERVEFITGLLTTADFTPEIVKKWQREIYLEFIKYKWPRLFLQILKPKGIVNLSNLSIMRRFFDFKGLTHRIKSILRPHAKEVKI